MKTTESATRRFAKWLQIFRPDGHGNAQLLGSMQISHWPQLVGQFSH